MSRFYLSNMKLKVLICAVCFFALFNPSFALQKMSGGISLERVKDVNGSIIYSPSVDFSRLPNINYFDLGYFVKYKPLNMLSSGEIALIKPGVRKNFHTNYGAAPSVYNISFENGGELNFQNETCTIEELVRRNPKKAEYLYAYAVKLKNEGSFDASLNQIDKALDIDYNYALGHFLKGDVLREAGRFKEASREYFITLQINPYCTDAYFNIAKMLEINGNIDLALNYYEMAYSVSPNDLEIRNQILKLSRKKASVS